MKIRENEITKSKEIFPEKLKVVVNAVVNDLVYECKETLNRCLNKCWRLKCWIEFKRTKSWALKCQMWRKLSIQTWLGGNVMIFDSDCKENRLRDHANRFLIRIRIKIENWRLTLTEEIMTMWIEQCIWIIISVKNSCKSQCSKMT